MTGRARGPAVRGLPTTDVTTARGPVAGAVSPVVVPVTALARLTPSPVTSPAEAGYWRRHAACADSDPEMFYPLSYRDDVQVRPARRVCGRCPVRTACLADVMATEDPSRRWGISGGTTPQERSALFRAGLTVAPDPAPVTAGGGAA